MLVALAAILTLATIVLLVFRPYYGVLALFVAKPIIDMTWDFRPGGISMTILISAVVPLILLPRLLSSKFWQKNEYKPWLYLGLLYVSVEVIASILLFVHQDAYSSFDSLVRTLNGLTAMLMLPYFIRERKDLELFLIAIMVAGVAPMLVSLYGEITGTVWRERLTVGLNRNIGLYHNAVSIRHFGLQSILALIIYIDLFAPRALWKRLLLFAFGIGTAIMLYKGYVRGGMATIAVWAVILIFINGKIKIALGAVAVSLFGIFALQINLGAEIEQLFLKEISFYDGTLADDRYVLNGRAFVWGRHIEEWSHQDFLGQLIGGQYTGSGTHLEPLRALLGGGILGLITYSVTILMILFLVGIRFLKGRRRAPLSLYAVLVVIMYLVESMGATPGLFAQYMWFTFGLLGVLLLHEKNIARAAAPMPRRSAQRFNPGFRNPGLATNA